MSRQQTAKRVAFWYYLLCGATITLIVLASSALFLFQVYREIGTWGLPIDDGWIHFRFARNLAEGYGFCFNKGQPVGGSTAPLWTVTLALVYRLTGELMVSSFVVGILLLILSGLLVYEIGLLLSGSRAFAMVTGLVAVSLGRLTWGALSGMEISLSVFLTLLGIYLYLRDRQPPASKSLISTVVFALAGLTRPESYLLFFVSLLDRLITALLFYRKQTDYRSFALNVLKHLVIFLLIVSPYAIFCYVTSGSFLPHTFSAKVGKLGLLGALSTGNLDQLYAILVHGLKQYLQHFTQELRITNLLMASFLYPGLTSLTLLSFVPGSSLQVLFFEKGPTEEEVSRGPSFLIPLIFILYPLAVGIVVPADRISWPWFRHLINLLPLLVIIGMFGLFTLLGALHYIELSIINRISFLRQAALAHNPSFKTIHKTICAYPLSLAAVLFFAVLLITSLVDNQRAASTYYTERVSTMQREHVAMARWIDVNVPTDAVLALSDIGAITFFTDRRIIDIEGLVTPALQLDDPRHSEQKDQAILNYLRQEKPDYLVTFYWLYEGIPAENKTPLHQEGNLMIYEMKW